MAMPGAKIANRPLHFFWLVDTSYSMDGDKIQSLNQAIKDTIPVMQDESDNYPEVRLMVRVIKFSNHAEWLIADPVEIHDFEWNDLSVDGMTAMGEALELVADAFSKMKKERAIPPVVALITDGYATDDFMSGLDKLNKEPWGKKCIRIAIGVGENVEEDELKTFVGERGQYIPVRNTSQLIAAIKWVSTVVVQTSSSSEVKNSEEAGQGTDLEYIPDEDVSTDEVW